MTNNVFDCLNSSSIFSYRFKQPIKQSTAAQIFDFFIEAINYFSNIRLKRDDSLITTSLKTGFLGLDVDINS